VESDILAYNWSPEALERLRTDRAAGLSFREIEKKWNRDATRKGITRNAVAGKCAALSLPSVTQAHGGYAARHGVDRSRDPEFRSLWTRMTVPSLAAHFSINESTVRTWGRRLNLPSRAVYLPPLRRGHPVVVSKKPSKPIPIVLVPTKPKVFGPIEDEPYTASRSQRKCQWVTSERPVRMCASLVSEIGSPWCAKHRRCCFVRMTPPRDDGPAFPTYRT
jgi:hypothetical protein